MKIPTCILAVCPFLLLALPAALGAAWGSRVEPLPVGGDLGIWQYEVRTREVHSLFTGHAEAVDSVACSPDGRTLASGSMDGTVLLWDLTVGSSSPPAPGISASDARQEGDGRDLFCYRGS